MNLQDYVLFLPHVFTDAVCDDLIRLPGKPIPVMNNNFHLEKVELPSVIKWVFGDVVAEYRTTHKHLPKVIPGTYARSRFEVGEWCGQHTDEGNGTLNISVTLSEHEGGQWSFFDGKLIKNVPKGTAVVFPSNFLFPHGILPVTDGTRYSLIAWCKHDPDH